MAITCTASDIAESAKCWQNPCVTEADRLAIAVLLAAEALNAAGGTDYRDDFNQLFQDSVGIIVYGHRVITAEELALMWDGVEGVPANVDAALELVKCIRCQPLKVLRKALLFLQCAVNSEG
jgi:hypothetical protein